MKADKNLEISESLSSIADIHDSLTDRNQKKSVNRRIDGRCRIRIESV